MIEVLEGLAGPSRLAFANAGSPPTSDPRISFPSEFEALYDTALYDQLKLAMALSIPRILSSREQASVYELRCQGPLHPSLVDPNQIVTG